MPMSVPGNSCRSCSSPSSTVGCPIRVSGKCVYYAGTPFSSPIINTGEDYDSILGKLVAAIEDAGSGSVTSVALSMPSAFSVAGSPITSSGTFSITGAGTSSQFITGAGTLGTADNGLTPGANTLKLGGALTQATSITSSIAANNLTISGNSGLAQNGQLRVINSGTSGVALYAEATSLFGVAVRAVANVGVAVSAVSNSTSAFSGTSFVGPVAQLVRDDSGTNDVVPLMSLNRTVAGGTAAAGVGGSIEMFLEDTSGSSALSHQIITRWTTSTSATRTSEFSIAGVNSAVNNTLLVLAGNGRSTFPSYGDGNFTAGTMTFALGVDSSGNVMEFTPSTGTLTAANNGLTLSGTTVQLGNLDASTSGQLAANRYIPSGNNILYLVGNGTDGGSANLGFDDTQVAISGGPSKTKTWMRFEPLMKGQGSTPFYFGQSVTKYGVNRPNEVMMWGWNLGPTGSIVEAGKAAIGFSLESHYDPTDANTPLLESHQFYVTSGGTQTRISSTTINTATGGIDHFHQVSSWELKDVDAGAEVWAQYTGGNGGTSTNHYLYSGTTNQYKLQTGFSVSGGNTTASISTDGPGNREFYLNNSVGGWHSVFLPSMFSTTTYNQFNTQVLPSADGTLRFGDPTNKWLTVNNYYNRSAFGMRIGDFSADQLPVANFEIYGPGNGTLGNIYVQNTTTAIGGIVVESPSGGHSFVLLKAQTGSGLVPQLGLIDYDDANFAAGMALERSSSPILGGAQNDLLISNAGSGKDILFGTNPGAGRLERIRITSSGIISINDSTPEAAAILQASSTTQGFLPPRMTTTQRDAISSPPAGLMIYNTTTNKLNVFTTVWEQVTSA